MQKLIENFYIKIKDFMTEEEFKNEILNIKNESDDLFNENICALLLLDKLNGSKSIIKKISNLEKGMDSTVIAKVINIGDIREFEKKNGNRGKVVNLKIQDDSGICGLVLWDKDVNLIKNNIIRINSIIKLINGYVKKGIGGIEINAGRWSLIENIDYNNTFKKFMKNENSISGRILEILPTRPFFKDNGDYGFFTSVKIKENNLIKKLFIWDEKVKEIQNYKSGDFVIFEKINFKNNKGTIEYHVNSDSIIKKYITNN